jgi:glycosyltransferase involved in cell wall biosynthesis
VNIAVNTRFLLQDKIEGIGKVTFEILKRLVHLMPDTSFDFLFDRKHDAEFIFHSNVNPKVIYPPTRHPLLTYAWLQFGVRRFLSQGKHDLYFSFDGFMPLGTQTPRIITIHDLAYAHFPEQNRFADRWYYQHFMPKFASEAEHIITVSQFSKSDICTNFKLPGEKVTSIYNGVSEEFHPIQNAQKQVFRKKFAAGSPYYLYLGSIHPRKNVAGLIRAFDSFKKKSSSNKKLLITGRKGWLTSEVEKAYESVSSKEEIIFTGYVPKEELPGLLGTADALCYLSLFEGFGLPIVEAMASGVPVICSNRNSMVEVANGAAACVDPQSTDSIAEAMQQIDQDQNFVNQLISSGLERRKSFSWDAAAIQYRDVLNHFAQS